MLVVSNTSPISYLVLIGAEELLEKLYGEVLIPEAVQKELAHPDAPALLKQWIESPPEWLKVKGVQEPREGWQALAELDAGEREAIQLAVQIQADLLILDERAGRAVAAERKRALTGTVGVLGAGVQHGFVDAAEVVQQLRQTSFRASPDLYRWLLDQRR